MTKADKVFDPELLDLIDNASPEDIPEIVDSLPQDIVDILLARLEVAPTDLPAGPAEQALELDEGYVVREQTSLISDRIAAAVADVEAGQSRFLIIETPPRVGKSTLVSLYGPLWIMRKHPNWKIVLTSYDVGLVTGWSRQIRRLITDNPSLGVTIERDGGAAATWATVQGGEMRARSLGTPLTGQGAKVLVIDDPVKDFADAHSPAQREAVWNWWLAVAQTRFEPPVLVIVTMTRWHEDDFVGRLLSDEYEGDPAQWEEILLPALAGPNDRLGREEGEPLLSPLIDETPEQALVRWQDVRTAVGTYTFSAMYQQRPAPAKGAIFNADWWKFWSRDPERATEDGRVVHLEPETLTHGRWLDSWDCAFKDTKDSDWVVGQRWVKAGPNRYLVWQARGRWGFTATLGKMKEWGDTNGAVPCSRWVHQRLVEEKANGAAIIDVLKHDLTGLKPINPAIGKEGRARAVTPECESGHVYLPHPSDPGNEWVADLLSELRNFPFDAHDDQVDALTQALGEFRESGGGSIGSPARSEARLPTSTAASAMTDPNRRRDPRVDLGRRRAITTIRRTRE